MRVVCEAGHIYEMLPEFHPPDEVIGSIAWCTAMTTKPEHGLLVLECGERVVWSRKRHGLTEPETPGKTPP